MPRKPRKTRKMRRPGPGASMEKKRAWMELENKRLTAEDSKWRVGWSSADSKCLCLLAAESLKE